MHTNPTRKRGNTCNVPSVATLLPTLPRSRFGLVLGSLTLLFISHVTLAAESQSFKAGFAERDITPKLGMEQPGGYGKSYHRSLHDTCKVRACVFDDGAKRVAIVGLDALVLRRPSVLAARKGIEEKCGIPGDCVLISASHSHSSGPTGMILPGEYDHASPLVRKLAYEQSSCADAGYLAHVEQQIIEAVVEANERRVEARCGAGVGHEDKVAFNRRFRMRSGLAQTHPRQGNPDIVEAAGPTDPDVGVIGAWDKEGRFLGCVVNYACHATTSPGGISANYIYYLEKAVRGMMRDKAIVVFLPGASGDVTQVDNLSPYALRTGEPSAELELVQQESSKGDPAEWTFAKEIVLLDALMQTQPQAEVEVQALQVGPVVLVTDPAEYFCQFGLDIKAGSKFPITLPVSLANGCVGYVPTEEAFGPRGGGYETRLTSYSTLEITAGRQMADTGIALANQLQPGVMPTPPLAAPFKSNAWAYGNVPPEVD
jgi:neutral ceramidase